jgi:SAM-dependent methyltransferase
MRCEGCARRYPLSRGTPRLLPGGVDDDTVRHRTAESFAYEWKRFGAPREEWERNFRDYMRPHGPEFFQGRAVLDAGAGSGRHALHAHRYGAEVAAVDLGGSIDVARANLPRTVLTVQADVEHLPFEDRSFDFVMCIGVLHHLADPEPALRSLVRVTRPGGRVRIYLYWLPESRVQRAVLRLVGLARRATVRMPHRLLHGLCYPLAAILALTLVAPYRALRRRRRGRALVRGLPLQAYADYSFAVLVNDQFDRFSAPVERRYRREEVEAVLARAGLVGVEVHANAGWVGEGVVPEASREARA